MGVLFFPVESTRITSYFGKREAPTANASTDHKGIDISIASGSAVRAANSGIITDAGYNTSAGNFIVISGSDGITTKYMHLSQLIGGKGETVQQGQIIGKSGNTGISTGAHLHFGVYENGIAQDPLKYNYIQNIDYVNQNKNISEDLFINENIKAIIPIAVISLVILAILRQ